MRGKIGNWKGVLGFVTGFALLGAVCAGVGSAGVPQAGHPMTTETVSVVQMATSNPGWTDSGEGPE
jgi:hypothetical protein